MRIELEVTPARVFAWGFWGAVIAVLVAALVAFESILNGSDRTGAGYMLLGVSWIMQQHPYAVFVPTIAMGFGVAHDVMNGKSPAWAVARWHVAGIAIYILIVFAIMAFIFSR